MCFTLIEDFYELKYYILHMNRGLISDHTTLFNIISSGLR